jgi:hypothetical protein
MAMAAYFEGRPAGSSQSASPEWMLWEEPERDVTEYLFTGGSEHMFRYRIRAWSLDEAKATLPGNYGWKLVEEKRCV